MATGGWRTAGAGAHARGDDGRGGAGPASLADGRRPPSPTLAPSAVVPGSLRVEMRQILMVWQLEVAEEYKLSTETFQMSAVLVDRSLEGRGKKRTGKPLAGRGHQGWDKSGASGEMIVQKDKL